MLKRQREADSLHDCAKRMLVAATKQDQEFIQEQLTMHPSLVAPLASMIRDGTLVRIINEKDCPASTEKKIPSNLKKWRGARSELVMEILGVLIPTKANIIQQKILDKSVHSGFAKSLMLFALGVDAKTDLPLEYKDARVVVTFLRLCRARYEQLGNRLSSYSEATPSVGYFSQAEPNTNIFKLAVGPMAPLEFALSLPTETFVDEEFYIEDLAGY
jgi:hypothetical protein